MLLLSSRANQISTKVKTNQMANRIAVTTRFLRQYSWCFADSSNQASPQEKEPTRVSTTRLSSPDAYTNLTLGQIKGILPRCTNGLGRAHSEQLIYSCRQFLRREWLGDVEVGTDRKSLVHLHVAAPGGEHDDLDVPPVGALAHALAHVVTAAHRHHHIEQHQIGPV